MKRTNICILLCFALLLVPMMTSAENPTKDELAESIAKIEHVQKVFPVLPQDQVIGGATCLVGTYAICTHPDGTVTAYCSDPGLTCEEEPSPSRCPEVCKEQGKVVVIDYGKSSCGALADGTPFAFICITPEEYAEHRSDCGASSVPRYDSSNSQQPWLCQIPIGDEHISTSVFDALLLERSRTSYIQEHLEDQINELNEELNKICDCPGVFNPVLVGNTQYINECEAKCAESAGSSSGQ